MNKHEVLIDKNRCVGCGMCAGDCISHNLAIEDKKAKVLSDDCIMCGHCVAICPQEAVSITGFDGAPVAIEKSISLNPDDVMAVIRSRRTIRQFQHRPVPEDVIKQIIEAGRLTHTARNAQDVSFIVLDKCKDEAQRIAVEKFRGLKKLGDALSSLIRRSDINDEFFFFHAPVVIVVAAKNETDAVLAAQNMEFVAEAYGLGTLISGFFTIAARTSSKLKSLLGVPAGKKVFATLVMGYPKVKYQRTAPREKADVIYR